jgi:hypothetical protein
MEYTSGIEQGTLKRDLPELTAKNGITDILWVAGDREGNNSKIRLERTHLPQNIKKRGYCRSI